MKKNKKLLIVYVILILIIALGFAFGNKTEEYSGGFTIYDYTKKVGNFYASHDVGDRTINKYIGWYTFNFVRNTEYYEGNIKVPDKTIREGEAYYRIQGVGSSNYDHLHQVYLPEIIVSSIVIILMLICPILFIQINKIISKKKKITKIKKLKEQLDLEIITKEEYENQKNTILKS